MKYVLLFVLGTFLLFSCRYFGGKRVRGNGHSITQERSISGFEGLKSYGSFDITIVPSATTSVKVQADENLQQYIETYVDGRDLHVSTRDGYNLRPQSDIKITVSGPTFNTIATHGSGSIISQSPLTGGDDEVRLQVAGSGNIEVEMKARKISSSIAGSGNINVKGTSDHFNAEIAGSGNIRAANLEVTDANVRIAGSGNIDVFANNNLDVKIMGSGEVRHRGNAQVSSHISGSGSVSKMN
jgi:hypothetical protein